jgi:hypothetical protein
MLVSHNVALVEFLKEHRLAVAEHLSLIYTLIIAARIAGHVDQETSLMSHAAGHSKYITELNNLIEELEAIVRRERANSK